MSNPQPAITNLFHYGQHLDFELDPIISFVDNSSKMIEQESIELKKKIEEYDKNIDKDDPYSGFDAFEYDVINIGAFDNILFSSVYVTIYSKLETNLFGVCNFCQNALNIKLNVKDISGRNYIEKCKKYLEKVVEVDFTRINKIWEKISYYQRIRNIIVHAEGRKSINDKSLLSFLKKTNGVSYSSENNLVKINDKDFVIEFCKEVYKMLNDIMEEIVIQKK